MLRMYRHTAARFFAYFGNGYVSQKSWVNGLRSNVMNERKEFVLGLVVYLEKNLEEIRDYFDSF